MSKLNKGTIKLIAIILIAISAINIIMQVSREKKSKEIEDTIIVAAMMEAIDPAEADIETVEPESDFEVSSKMPTIPAFIEESSATNNTPITNSSTTIPATKPTSTTIIENPPVQDPEENYTEDINEIDNYTKEEYDALSFDEKYQLLVDSNYYGFGEEDYIYLLYCIFGEGGCCSRHHQMAIGSVVLNRYNNDKYFKYGDSIKAICLAKSQYGCFPRVLTYGKPTKENKEVAMELLRYGSIYPANVIFQAEFKQGDGVYEEIYDPIMQNITYFCYKD